MADAPYLPPPTLTVLIVDDDPDMRIYLKQCLGFLEGRLDQVLEATDGLEALELAFTVSLDLVIADVVIPKLDGYALCQALKTETLLHAIPVLLISGEDPHQRVQHTEADAFLSKPFNAARLQRCLEGLLSRPP